MSYVRARSPKKRTDANPWTVGTVEPAHKGTVKMCVLRIDGLLLEFKMSISLRNPHQENGRFVSQCLCVSGEMPEPSETPRDDLSPRDAYLAPGDHFRL